MTHNRSLQVYIYRKYDAKQTKSRESFKHVFKSNIYFKEILIT